MATYFIVANDKTLLPPDIRTDPELANVAPLAEADVIGMFTEAPPYLNYTARAGQLADGIVSQEVQGVDISASVTGPQLRVYLRGYAVDAAQADTNLAAAMKRTIAEVIRWRMNQWKREQGLSSSSDSVGKNRAYLENFQDAFPPEWDRWLRPFRSDEVCWGLG